MELYLQFVSHHWHWFALLTALLAGLAWYESRKAGPQVSPQQLSLLVNNENALVLDVRPDKEYRQGHIVDALNIPFNQFADRVAQLDKHKQRPVVLVCKMGQHASSVAKQLRGRGFEKIYRLSGGMMEWSGSQMPVVKS
jgi:rhodanese-related sulfurtransferase